MSLVTLLYLFHEKNGKDKALARISNRLTRFTCHSCATLSGRPLNKFHNSCHVLWYIYQQKYAIFSSYSCDNIANHTDNKPFHENFRILQSMKISQRKNGEFTFFIV